MKTTGVRKAAASTATAAKAAPRKRVTKEPEADPGSWMLAVRAAESKKAEDIKVLDLKPVTTFTDTLVICTGTNSRQIQAISDEIEKQIKEQGERPNSIEGYTNAEWILMDYGDFVVNIFSDNARKFYDLERLWRDAPEVKVPAAV